MFFYLKLRGEKCGANEEMFVLLKVLRTVDSLSPPHTPLLPVYWGFYSRSKMMFEIKCFLPFAVSSWHMHRKNL